MRRMYRAVVSALLRRRTFTLEWFLALESLFCGLWLLSPHVAVRPDVIFSALPEWALGFVFLGHGAAATAILMRGHYGQPRSQRNLDLCRQSALASAALWTMLAVGYAIAQPVAGLAVPILLGFVASALWVYMRLFLRFTEDP